jgi:hypothetical protein
MIHHNPIGWGCLDGAASVTSCGKRATHVSWSGNIGAVSCKRCKALAAARRAETNEDLAQSEGRQSGGDSRNAQGQSHE